MMQAVNPLTSSRPTGRATTHRPAASAARAPELGGLEVLRCSVAALEVLYTPERPAEPLYVLLAGRVSVARVTYEGKRLVTDLLGPGDVFGNLALARGAAAGETAVAVEACEVLALDPEAAVSLVESDPRWLFRLLGATTDRLRGTADRLEEFAYSTVEERVAGAILRYASDDDRTARASHQEIAEVAGTYRETATRVLNALQARGALQLGRCAIRIEDEAELASLAHRAPLPLAG